MCMALAAGEYASTLITIANKIARFSPGEYMYIPPIASCQLPRRSRYPQKFNALHEVRALNFCLLHYSLLHYTIKNPGSK